MYILTKGRVQVEKLGKDGKIKVTGTLSEGVYFGERAILYGTRRQASIRALTFCETNTITRPDLDRVMAEFPSVEQLIRQR